MSTAVEVIVTWKIKESELERILKLLPELAEKSRHEEGNLSYAIYQSESDPAELILHEKYSSTEAAEAHRNSEHYRSIVADQIIPHLAHRQVTRVRQLF